MSRETVSVAGWNIVFVVALASTVAGGVARFLGATWHDVGPVYAIAASLWMLLWLHYGYRHD